MNPTQIRHARSADLLQLAGQYTRLKHIASSGGGEWAGPCPIPGCRCHRDGFRVQPTQNRWLCRNCTDGKWQDAINLVMRIEGLPFEEAVQHLAGATLPTAPVQVSPACDGVSMPPSSTCQMRAGEVILRAQELLWGQAGAASILWDLPDERTSQMQSFQFSPVDWLQRRGLKDETIQKFKLGWIPRDTRDDARHWGIAGKPLFLSQGIIIPSKGSWVSFFQNKTYLGIGKCGMELFEDHHPAMVDRETWDKVQEIQQAHPQPWKLGWEAPSPPAGHRSHSDRPVGLHPLRFGHGVQEIHPQRHLALLYLQQEIPARLRCL